MIRQVIKIDEEKCNGCGLCVNACHEGAIGLVHGKARLMRDDYCDGLGDCLPSCPTGAISFEQREAADYDEAAVLRAKAEKAAKEQKMQEKAMAGGCPGSRMMQFDRSFLPAQDKDKKTEQAVSELRQWPVQIKLVPVKAPYFEGADLLVAADCTAYAYASFHQDFIRGRVTLVGCPKLDDIDYSEKLTEILRQNDIRNVVVVRMEVPCCGGLENAVKTALQNCGKMIPWQVKVIATDGTILA
ncbi:MAG: 4Fe-4S binding protein [Lachnospiraceae bacterium]|nr:4Fe-4S binding protein [Lachnospiraceae bacterium]